MTLRVVIPKSSVEFAKSVVPWWVDVSHAHVQQELEVKRSTWGLGTFLAKAAKAGDLITGAPFPITTQLSDSCCDRVCWGVNLRAYSWEPRVSLIYRDGFNPNFSPHAEILLYIATDVMSSAWTIHCFWIRPMQATSLDLLTTLMLNEVDG